MFCEEKKTKCPKENFQSVKRGKCLSIEFRVFGKKMKGGKEKKVLGDVLGGIFAKFVFTG